MRLRSYVLTCVLGYPALWALTAIAGDPAARRAALEDPFWGGNPTGCLYSVPTTATHRTVCYVAVRTIAPFVIHVDYGVSGMDVGWSERHTEVWLFGLRVPLSSRRFVV
jgi:hypothetical protein